MAEHQLLDDNIDRPRIPPALQRWNWYWRHAMLILGLNLIAVLLLLIMPYLSDGLYDILSIVLLLFFILGMYGITGYTCRVGFKWSLMGSFLGASMLFLTAFVGMMSYIIDLKTTVGPKLEVWLNIPDYMQGDTQDLLLVGLGYSVVTIPLAELLVMIGYLNQGWKARWLQRSNKENGSNE